jgi:HAE1 family hydrophobic/amphiphilic exporter-1
VGTPIERTEAVLGRVERAILADPKGIEKLLVTYGYDPSESQRSDEGEHTARFKFVVSPSGRTPAGEESLLRRLRHDFEGIPDLEYNVTRPVLFSSKTPIEVEVLGDDLQALRRKSEEVQAALGALPELADVQATLRAGAPEVQVVYDRDRLMRYDLDLGAVARRIRDRVKGYEATRLNRVDRRIPMVVQYAEQDRRSVEDVETMVVNPGGERPIQLAAVAKVQLGEGPSEVRRIDGRRVALLRANLEGGSLGGAVHAIEARLDRMDWPAEMTYYISGQNEEWERSRASLYLALALSIFLVYVIMAIQFESLLHPLVIMFTIPLAFVGTVWTLKALSIPLSVVVFLGMIMLAGIVVNNAIVLVDYVNQLRRRGLGLDEALVTAGQVRLRPILMTTATTVLGLLPMALGLGDGAEIRTPMAIAVISGLVSSTALTLLILPTIYRLADRWIGQRLPADETARFAGSGEEAGSS